MTTHDTLIGLLATAFGVAFVVKPRWWSGLQKPGVRPPTERDVASGAVVFFVIGVLLLALMAFVFIARLT
jgi:hypothetical protein